MPRARGIPSYRSRTIRGRKIGSVPQTRAEIDLVWLTDGNGRPIGLPAVTVEHLRSSGLASVQLDVNLYPAQPPKPWLTVTEAAQQLVSDMRPPCDEADAKRLLSTAKGEVARACATGQLRSDGVRSRRRIDPESLDTWCLARRRRADLD